MRYEIEGQILTDIADSIRDKTGKSALIKAEDMAEEIDSIEGSGGISLLPAEYQHLEYIAVESAGPMIDTGVKSTSTAYFELDAKYDAVPLDNYGLFGTMHGGEFVVNSWRNLVYLSAGSDHGELSGDDMIARHVYKADSSAIYIDGVRKGNVSWSNAQNSKTYRLFAFIYNDNTIYKTANARIYMCKIYVGANMARLFIPCKRIADNELGFFDIVTNAFYTNDGTGSFVAGPSV